MNKQTTRILKKNINYLSLQAIITLLNATKMPLFGLLEIESSSKRIFKNEITIEKIFDPDKLHRVYSLY